jgi:hypothetical protein
MKKSLTILSVIGGNIAFAFAQSSVLGTVAIANNVNKGPLVSLLQATNEILVRLVPIAIGLAVLAFFVYLIMFIWKGRDDATEQKKTMAGMGYSILALFLMVSIWGIIGLLGSMFGVGQGGSVPIPTIPTSTN